MSSATITHSSRHSTEDQITSVKLAMSYFAAHFTAISTVGILYLLGLFDVGFLSQESLAIKLVDYVLAIMS